MKIAIHLSKHNFGERWLEYCKLKGIPFKCVNCYDNNIIEQLSDCNALMWHHFQTDPKSVIFAKQLLFSLEQSGKIVFPDFRTGWHFDDKLGQKYLLEAIGAPLVPSYVYFDINEALDWIKETTFPKVFKLRGGAGSANVRYVKNYYSAKKIIKQAFGRGFRNYEPFSALNEKIRKFKLGKASIIDVFKGIAHIFISPKYSKIKGREKGYVYFQDFIHGNSFDIRIVVVDNKAFAIKRMVRKNDFRASGSGFILYEKELVDEDTVILAFKLSDKLKTQCVAFDFVYDNKKPRLLEISYGFVAEGYDRCPGYWDKSMNWIKGKFDPYGWMVEIVLKSKNE